MDARPAGNLRERKKATGADARTRSQVTTPAVAKVAEVLQVLSTSSRPIGVSQIARTTHLPKSTVYALLTSLSAVGLAHRSPSDGSFSLGGRILDFARSFLEGGGLTQRFHEEARDFAARTGETVQLARLDGREVVYLAKVDGERPVSLASRVGARLPASTTALGKALLSLLSPEEFQARYPKGTQLPALTSLSIKTIDRLRTEVEAVRTVGIAYDVEETAMGLCCVAIPIGVLDGLPHAISSSYPPTPSMDKKASALASQLTEMRQRLLDGPLPAIKRPTA